jgi:hypothetical protein
MGLIQGILTSAVKILNRVDFNPIGSKFPGNASFSQIIVSTMDDVVEKY